jgi:predicted lipase
MCLSSQGNNSATGFVAADHTKKKVVISLRGSVAFSNWMADLKFIQTPCPQYGGKGSACNIGFLGFWEQCKPFALKGLAMGLQENPTYGVVVTGHSLGAAAAVYAAAELRAKYKGLELVRHFLFCCESSNSFRRLVFIRTTESRK